ncbi:MAG: glycoside hydrolase family 3 C-terminal domain-containing protein [Bacteroidales bacterium]
MELLSDNYSRKKSVSGSKKKERDENLSFVRKTRYHCIKMTNINLKAIEMKRNSLFGLIFCLFLCSGYFSAIAQTQSLPQLGKDPVNEVIKAMTLEEKATLVVGDGFYMPGMSFPGMSNQEPTGGHKKVPGCAGATAGIQRLGIPALSMSDGPSGVNIYNMGVSRLYYATAWPVGTLLASSWDTALVRQVGTALGREAKEYGLDILEGPGMNLHRNPRGGRNFEYYSEDPVITGNISAAMINGIQSNGIGVATKHFAANNQETDRQTVNTIVSERALREIYLKGWEIVVKKAQPLTIMSSYNLINGTYTSESYDLLTQILRNEWGFKGMVMTDWFGGKDPVAQMKAGNNLLMPGMPDQSKKLIEAVKSGKLDEKILDENVAGILNMILQTPSFKGYKYSDQPDLKKDAQISRDAAAQCMVLLKNNENALPVGKDSRRIALFGINSYELIAGGTGSGGVNKMYAVPLSEGLFKAGYMVDPDLLTLYNGYLSVENSKHPKKNMMLEMMSPSVPVPEYPVDPEMINKIALVNDRAVISIGRNSGEGADRKLQGDYYLNDIEKQMIKNVSDAFHTQNKKVVVVLNITGVIDVMQWRDYADAILLAWQPGLEGGNAIADVISGKADPSGRLATTFPASYEDVPSAKNFPGKEFPDKATTGMMGMKAIPAEVTYEEGIYVGYRYYSTFGEKTAYEFGYGLSYTDFTFSDLKLSSPKFVGNLTTTVTVTNTGKLPGKEVVQLYISAPVKNTDKPAEELRAFAKTGLLKPGESQTVTFSIGASDLASYITSSSSWIAEAGNYTVKIGSSSLKIEQTASFKLSKDIVVEKDKPALSPQVQINELKSKL